MRVGPGKSENPSGVDSVTIDSEAFSVTAE